jgi:acyl-CoA synthetase (AMP-forming)/AMP-acid ligase II
LRQSRDRVHLQLHRVQRVFLGGAPVFPDDLRGARALFPSAEITAVYGSTEAEPIADLPLSAITADDFAAMELGQGLLAGLPVPSIALRILRNQWGETIPPLDRALFESLCLGPDEVGEIVVSGPHVLGGYLHGAGDAETKFRVGAVTWHRTGDLGRLDNRGRLWLMGRASAIVEDDRGVLYPFCVECAVRQVPGVRHAALISVSARRILAIEGDQGVSTEDVLRHLAWAQLDEVRRVRAIPMDERHNAKVDYVALRRMMARF